MSDTKRQDNLLTYQKGIEYGPSSTGGPDPLNDQSDKLKITTSEGKDGSTTSRTVESFAKAEGEL